MPNPYYHNGRRYSSKRAFIRSMRGYFYGLPSSGKKNFKPVTIYSTRPAPQTKISGKNQRQIKQTVNDTTTITTLKSVKEGDKYKFKVVNESARVSNYVKEDKQGNIIEVAESEESSRYTPSKVRPEVANLDDDVIQVSASAENGRTVKSTTITVRKNQDAEVKEFGLAKKYALWEEDKFSKDSEHKMKVRDELVPFARSLGIDEGLGAPTETKVKRLIKQRLEENKVSATTKKNEDRKNTPVKPVHGKTDSGTPSQRASPEELEYFYKVNGRASSDELTKTTVEKYQRDLKQIYDKINTDRRKGGVVPFGDVRSQLEAKGYNRFEQDVLFLTLEKKRIIELQIAHDVSVSRDPQVHLYSHRGAINYILWRK